MPKATATKKRYLNLLATYLNVMFHSTQSSLIKKNSQGSMWMLQWYDDSKVDNLSIFMSLNTFLCPCFKNFASVAGRFIACNPILCMCTCADKSKYFVDSRPSPKKCE